MYRGGGFHEVEAVLFFLRAKLRVGHSLDFIHFLDKVGSAEPGTKPRFETIFDV